MVKFELGKGAKMQDAQTAVAAHNGDIIRVTVDDYEAIVVKRKDTRTKGGANYTGYPKDEYIKVKGKMLTNDQADSILLAASVQGYLSAYRVGFYGIQLQESGEWDSNIYLSVAGGGVLTTDGKVDTLIKTSDDAGGAVEGDFGWVAALVVTVIIAVGAFALYKSGAFASLKNDIEKVV